jgi:hypothetical protein
MFPFLLGLATGVIVTLISIYVFFGFLAGPLNFSAPWGDEPSRR